MFERAQEAKKLYADGRERGSQLREFTELLNSYASARRKDHTPEDLLHIVRRYNSTWQPTATVPMAEPPGFNRIFPCEYALQEISGFLHMPFFYRMNFIKQLSTTYLWQHWEAGHSRLAHSVGVAAVAQSFLESIARNDASLLGSADRKAVITYAFIHDCFHGPLGHSMELMRDVFVPNYTGRLDKFFLTKELNDKNSPLLKAISSAMDADAPEVIRLLSLISSKDAFKRSNKDKYFLAQIVDSRFDADRIDYVFRDCLHLGKRPPAAAADVQEVIQRVRVLPLVEKIWGGEINSLHFSIHDKPLIESVLASRRELYLDFYEHPAKIILDDMICHAVFYVLSDKGVLPPSTGPLFDVCHNIVVEVGRLVDDDLLHFLYEAGGPLFAQLMLRDFMTNDVYREIDRRKIRVSEELTQRTLCLAESFEKRVKAEEQKRGKTVSSVLGLALTCPPKTVPV
jgi:HD superfamily phosphohydrolase